MIWEPKAKEAATKAYADSLIAVIKGGRRFADVARIDDIDQYKENGGQGGWLRELDALQGGGDDFKKAVFSMAVNQPTLVKMRDGGTCIVQVSERTEMIDKYKIAYILSTVRPSSATYSKIYNELNQFIATNQTIDAIEKSAREAGYDLMQNVRVQVSDPVIGTVEKSRQVVRWLFNNEEKISEIFECGDRYVVAMNKGKQPEGYQPQASVAPMLKSEIAAKKKGEELAASLKARNLTSIDAYAQAMNANVDTVKFVTMGTSRITNIGVEPKLNAYIAAAQMRKVSEPIVGEKGVYVLDVYNRTKRPDAYDEKTQRKMLVSNTAYRMGSLLMRSITDEAKVEDNRVRFY